MKKILLMTACVALLAVGCGKVGDSPAPGLVACTQEAKVCPDGSYVSRGGPECEFAKCPTATSTPPEPVSEKGGISGYVHMGPTCPVEHNPPDPNCADRPNANAEVIAIGPGGQQYQTQSDAAGKFSVALPVGTYTITVTSANMLPRCPEKSATVTANHFTSVDISCDTGIR